MPSAVASPSIRALYSPGVSVAAVDVAAVSRWLETWEVAAPLRPYSELALHQGDEEERTRTAMLLLDLRQPVYDSRAVFLRDCLATRALLEVLKQEREACRCTSFCGLPFLRAAWRVKPLLLALPAGWIEEAA